jgi:hypothetical protein
MNAFDVSILDSSLQCSFGDVVPTGVVYAEHSVTSVGICEQLCERWTAHGFPFVIGEAERPYRPGATANVEKHATCVGNSTLAGWTSRHRT